MADSPDPGLLHRPLSDVLAALASQHELAGGGGPAAALAAAAAAAVTARVARGSRATWIEAGGAIAHAESLRMQAQALIDRDVGAYHQAQAVLMESERSARVGVAGPALSADSAAAADRERRAGEVLAHAADLSLAIADAASEIAQLAARVARCCPSSLRPDALAAVALAEAAASGAAALVGANRQLPPDDRRRAASCAAAEAASRAREQGR